MASDDRVKVAILDDYQKAAFTSADWSAIQDKLLIDVYTETTNDEEQLVRRLKPYTVICTMRERTKFRASLLDKLPNLRLISTTGGKNAAIDVNHAHQNGVVVSGTNSKYSLTIEHVWALILATVRYVAADDADVKAGKAQWQTYMPLGLSGRTLGLVGLGNLGSQTAKIARAFNMKVAAWSPHLTREKAAAKNVEFVETKEELFRSSDIISIHLVLSERTQGLISAADLEQMKPTAFLVNTSRGPIIDEPALIDVLQRKKIAGAGLDVFNIEPLPIDHPFRKLDNVVLTPHTGYVNDLTYEEWWGQTVENIAGFLEGKPLRVIQN